MSDYTVVRIDIDSDVVRRAARAVPGVEVPEEFDPETERVTPLPGRTDTVADDADAVDDGSGRGGQPRSLVGEYGLLAAAVAMIGAGVATAGLWWYRRRNRDSAPTPETEFESPAWEETAVAATEDQPGSTGTVPNPDGVPGDRVAGDDDTAVAGDDSTGAGPTEFDAPTVDTPTDEPDTDAEPDAARPNATNRGRRRQKSPRKRRPSASWRPTRRRSRRASPTPTSRRRQRTSPNSPATGVSTGHRSWVSPSSR
ncbi:hypothetical protein ACFQL1_14125 [Halomicroarcula sp. GCM10025709]|uniref:hypothetical protein n=1 Tax=Halomicroarcula sp. GCM10025709 TaxID=3252669 RepID=UPI00360FBF2A